MTIVGTASTTAATVDFGSAQATGVVVSSSTSLTATSPAGPSGGGTVAVTVTTTSGTSASALSANDEFSYTAAPTVTGISPGSGPVAGGTAVLLRAQASP